MTNLIECGTCGYPLTPEERGSLIEHDGRMVKAWQGLTEHELYQAWVAAASNQCDAVEFIQSLARNIETRLRLKNGGADAAQTGFAP